MRLLAYNTCFHKLFKTAEHILHTFTYYIWIAVIVHDVDKIPCFSFGNVVRLICKLQL